MTVGLPKRSLVFQSPWAARYPRGYVIGEGITMKHDYRLLLRQLAVFVSVIGVSYILASLLPRLTLLSSVSWNLGIF